MPFFTASHPFNSARDGAQAMELISDIQKILMLEGAGQLLNPAYIDLGSSPNDIIIRQRVIAGIADNDEKRFDQATEAVKMKQESVYERALAKVFAILEPSTYADLGQLDINPSITPRLKIHMLGNLIKAIFEPHKVATLAALRLAIINQPPCETDVAACSVMDQLKMINLRLGEIDPVYAMTEETLCALLQEKLHGHIFNQALNWYADQITARVPVTSANFKTEIRKCFHFRAPTTDFSYLYASHPTNSSSALFTSSYPNFRPPPPSSPYGNPPDTSSSAFQAAVNAAVADKVRQQDANRDHSDTRDISTERRRRALSNERWENDRRDYNRQHNRDRDRSRSRDRHFENDRRYRRDRSDSRGRTQDAVNTNKTSTIQCQFEKSSKGCFHGAACKFLHSGNKHI